MLRRRRVPRDHNLRRAQEPLALRPASVPSDPRALSARNPFQRELSTKRRGEAAELAFALAAARRGFGISRPYGDSERYDVILDPQPGAPWPDILPACRPRLVRVQVKATSHKLHGFYQLSVKRTINRGESYASYKPSEVDFIAAYIIPEDVWFIFPLTHVLGLSALLLKPKHWRRRHVYDRYREAWNLLSLPDGIEFA